MKRKVLTMLISLFLAVCTAGQLSPALSGAEKDTEKYFYVDGANGAKLTFGSNLRFYLGGETIFERITVEYRGTLNFVCEYNPVTFEDGFETKCLTSAASGVYVVGGFQSPTDKVPTDLDLTSP